MYRDTSSVDCASDGIIPVGTLAKKSDVDVSN